MTYRIEPLDKTELATLEWLAARGYDADILSIAGVEDYTDDGGAVLGEMSEADAWKIQEAIEEDPHAFLTCNGSHSLADKLYAFLNKIV